jgi:ankyrin repeat protein
LCGICDYWETQDIDVVIALMNENEIETILDSDLESEACLCGKRLLFLGLLPLAGTVHHRLSGSVELFRDVGPKRLWKVAHSATRIYAVAVVLLLMGCYANPLIEAAKKGNISEVTRLLDNGPDVNAVDAEGWTALIAASWSGQVKIVRLLIERGADLHARDAGGGTALMAAAKKGRTEVVKLLLENGADPNAKDRDGSTALMEAAWKDYLDVVKVLLDKGADVNSRSNEGATALNYAIESGGKEVKKILLEHGAKE